MNTMAGIEYFAATVEAGSFADAARRLGVTASAVSRKVAQLEHDLQVILLARTTRSLSLTEDGRAFYRRCLRILAELREAKEEIARSNQQPVGRLRVDAPIALGRAILAPNLPEFLARFPDIDLVMTLRDQYVDAHAEAIDVLVRIGRLHDSSLVARRLGASRLVVCASPAYLSTHGEPKTPGELREHRCLGFFAEGRPAPFRFRGADDTYDVDIQGPFHANDPELLRHGVLAGLGISVFFDFLAEADLKSGAMVRVLPSFEAPSWPIHALYPKNRHLLPKVRVFLEFLAELLGQEAAS